MNITTETSFVAGDKTVNTGNCGSFGPDWETATRNEAARIADGLGGTVVEIPADGPQTWKWTDHRKVKMVSKSVHLLALLVQVDGRTIARVDASEHISTNEDND